VPFNLAENSSAHDSDHEDSRLWGLSCSTKYSVPYNADDTMAAPESVSEMGLSGGLTDFRSWRNRYVRDQAVVIPLPLYTSPVDSTYPAPAKMAPNPKRYMIGGRAGLGGNTEDAKNKADADQIGHLRKEE